MYTFYHGHDVVKQERMSREEADYLIMFMLHNFHVIWTYKES